MAQRETLIGMFVDPPHRMADTSLEAHRRILPTLAKRELAVLMALFDYLRDTGHEDCTGGELAEYMRSLPTSTRPRLTGLDEKGYVRRTPARASRVQYESRCHGYAPTLPRAAVARAQQQAASGSSK